MIEELLSIKSFVLLNTIFAVFTFVLIYGLNAWKGKPIKIEEITMASFQASSIPTGVVLLLSGYDITLLQEIKGIGLYLSIAGLIFLHTIISKLKDTISKSYRKTESKDDEDKSN